MDKNKIQVSISFDVSKLKENDADISSIFWLLNRLGDVKDSCILPPCVNGGTNLQQIIVNYDTLRWPNQKRAQGFGTCEDNRIKRIFKKDEQFQGYVEKCNNQTET